MPVLPVPDTVKEADASGFVLRTVDRRALRCAQTPQGSRRDWLIEALDAALRAGREPTDEAQALEEAGRKVALVEGEAGNSKITTARDFEEADRLRAELEASGWEARDEDGGYRLVPRR